MAGVTKGAMALAIRDAEAGVAFTARKGALCPRCGKRARVVTTRPWEGPVRVRYHKCTNGRCLLSRLGVSIKSIEEDKAAVALGAAS